MAEVKLVGLRKSFGRTEVIHGVDLRIEDGEFVVFVGPSGCGKSTLLRLISGLEEATAGEIWIGGREVSQVPPARRGVSMVFQSYALYPHMNVYRNIAFGLSLAGASRADMEARVRAVAEKLQISELLERRPRELSGGQRQRVAIARAIVREPQVFLFDEPLSNLDAGLRADTRVEIARMHDELQATMIYVTHDQVEAMTLADRMVLLNDGRVEQIGPPAELYRQPRNLFVAGFLGSPRMNLLEVQRGEGGLLLPGGGVIAHRGEVPGGRLTLGLRSEDLHPASGEGVVRGEVTLVEELGETRLVHLRIGDGQSVIFRHRELPGPRPGEQIALDADPDRALLFDGNGERL
ncbi:MAG: ABC transporter ATP-binding protein [Alphaproteobacteria bacterium]|nr:ABC transporter ATP-binding protein [Alphaproteobacteria bacterium]